MPSPPDRRAVLVLILLGAAGVLVRVLAGSPGAPGAVAYHPAPTPRSPLDSVAARARRLARPLRRGETIDVDRASAEDLARLPRLGPGLAARIVANREANGPFGSLVGLDRVPGVGPSVIEAVRPYATFSGTDGQGVGSGPSGANRPVEPPGLAPSDLLNGTGSVRAPPARRSPRVARPPVSLNTAAEAELAQLPGVGATRAKAIVADRRRRGPFQSIEELGRVPGIGAALRARLQRQLRVP